MNYMLMPLRRYADFNGRSRRKEFWLWQLLNLLIQLVLIGSFFVMFLSAMGRVDARGGLERSSYSSNYESRYDEDRSSSDSDFGDSNRRSRDRGYSYSSGSRWDVDERMMAQELGTFPWILLGLGMLWSLIVFIPNIAVTIRRLHDQDKSGWMILLGLIPIVGAIILLVFYFIEGTRGPNRFGPDPKGPDIDRTFA